MGMFTDNDNDSLTPANPHAKITGYDFIRNLMSMTYKSPILVLFGRTVASKAS